VLSFIQTFKRLPHAYPAMPFELPLDANSVTTGKQVFSTVMSANVRNPG
jgi:hypothetical protein